VSASCPVCGEKHEWEISEARLQERGLRRDQ
jgi:hypothetical protein